MTDDQTLPIPGSVEAKRKRLRFRAWHRGTREMDLILGHFADAHVPTMTEAELIDFEALIGLPDDTVFKWITKREDVPHFYDTTVMARLQKLDYVA
ncbi:MAG: succinate dehydrogenase assembly factor 2 [Pseudomonadota bacterium]